MSSSYVKLVNPKADVARRGQAIALCISTATGLQEVLRTNLGPKGTLKMLVSGSGDIKITKDGRVLLAEMQIQNPVAMIMARAAAAQDDVTGDGTTSNLVLVAELLKLSGKYVMDGLHPRIIVDGFEIASKEALNFLETFKIKMDSIDNDVLGNVVRTSISTKLSPELAAPVSDAIVSSIQQIRPKGEGEIDLHMIEIQKMQTRSGVKTGMIKGLVMDHGTRHPNMPTSVNNAYILALNVSLEYEKSEINSGFFYSCIEERDKLVESERRFVNQKLEKIIQLKNSVCDTPDKNFVIINQKGIDPLALDILAKNKIMALRRAKRRNMERLQLCCGCIAQNSVDNLEPGVLGHADYVHEYVLGEEKFTFIEGVNNPSSVTILITAPNNYTINQINDAIRDGLRAAKNTIDDRCLVPGAAAFNFALYNHLTKFKSTVQKSARVGVDIFTEAILAIPKFLLMNAGHDILKSLVEVQANANSKIVGIDLETGKSMDPISEGIWDNYIVHKHVLSSCTAIASNFLLVDEIIRAGKSNPKEGTTA